MISAAKVENMKSIRDIILTLIRIESFDITSERYMIEECFESSEPLNLSLYTLEIARAILMKRSQEDDLQRRVCCIFLHILRSALSTTKVSVSNEDEHVALIELAFSSCSQVSRLELTKKLLDIISSPSQKNVVNVWCITLRLVNMFCSHDDMDSDLLESFRASIMPRLLTIFRDISSSSKLHVLCGQALSLWTPSRDMLKNYRLAYFMSYSRRLSSSSSYDLDISTCIDVITSMVKLEGNKTCNTDDLSKMESIILHDQHHQHERKGQSERVEILERCMFGTSTLSASLSPIHPPTQIHILIHQVQLYKQGFQCFKNSYFANV